MLFLPVREKCVSDVGTQMAIPMTYLLKIRSRLSGAITYERAPYYGAAYDIGLRALARGDEIMGIQCSDKTDTVLTLDDLNLTLARMRAYDQACRRAGIDLYGEQAPWR